ncbi:MAG: endonuclease domain-containing protein [Phycisphaerales bacterium]
MPAPDSARRPIRDTVRPSWRVADRARELRRDASMPERVFWNRIRDLRRLGFPFRRQHPLGPYVADFYCHRAALVVELDGQSHRERRDRDARRDVWMRAAGIDVVRVSVSHFTREEDAVIHAVLLRCRDRAAAIDADTRS